MTGAITTASRLSFGRDASLPTLLVSRIWMSVPAGMTTVEGAIAHDVAQVAAIVKQIARMGIKRYTRVQQLDEAIQTEVAP